MELSDVEATDKDLDSIIKQEVDEDSTIDEVIASFKKSNVNVYH